MYLLLILPKDGAERSNFFKIGKLQKQSNREYILVNYTMCSKPNTAVQVQFTKIYVKNPFVYYEGAVKFTKEIKFMSALGQYSSCPKNNQCKQKAEFPLPNICPVISLKNVFGDAVGSHFKPTLSCPVNPGNYKFNFSLHTAPIIGIPDVGVLHHLKWTLFVNKNKEMGFCLDFMGKVRNK
uniref:CSON011567 protein n=1 Tax=Culicoides sonorensis TaxID=179676 RepID=A0A336MFJ9_CULSO